MRRVCSVLVGNSQTFSAATRSEKPLLSRHKDAGTTSSAWSQFRTILRVLHDPTVRADLVAKAVALTPILRGARLLALLDKKCDLGWNDQRAAFKNEHGIHLLPVGEQLRRLRLGERPGVHRGVGVADQDKEMSHRAGNVQVIIERGKEF